MSAVDYSITDSWAFKDAIASEEVTLLELNDARRDWVTRNAS
jgi:hypothetical protein